MKTKNKATSRALQKAGPREVARVKELVTADRKLSAAHTLAARLAKGDTAFRGKANAVARDLVMNRRELGKVLGAVIPHQGGRPGENCYTLKQFGLDEGKGRLVSHRAQLLASIPEAELETAIREREEADVIELGPLYQLARLRAQTERVRKVREASEKEERPGVKVKDLSKAGGIYRCIYADPPWQYDDAGCDGAAEEQYHTMSLGELKDMAEDVAACAHEDGCHLWLWTTWPMIREGAPQEILDSWGFRWVGEIVWSKPGLGVGQWLRPASEILILAVKGSLPLLAKDQRGLIEARRGRHSEKPQEFYGVVERLTPGPRIELFARAARERWSRWGNES